MAQNDVFSGLSVDKILSDVKAQKGEKMRIWSLDELDQSLSESDDAPVAAEPTSAPHPSVSTAAEAEIAQEETPQEEPPRTTAMPFSADDLKAAAKRAAPIQYTDKKQPAVDETVPVASYSAEQPAPRV